MRQTILSVVAVAGLLLGAASAQHAQPYAGLEAREIKALSEEQIAELRAGQGMGLALAAELNGYPGPRHVIDLAEPLGLTDAQRAEVQALFDAMLAETVRIGETLIEQEAELDRQFAERTISVASLDRLTATIGAVQGALRSAHLKYHIATLAALSPEQVEHYKMLRGYGGGSGHHQHRAH